MTWTNVKTWEFSNTRGTYPSEWDAIWVELFEEWLPSLGHETTFIRREYQATYGQTVVEYGWIAYNTDVKDLSPAPNNLFVRWFPDNGPGYNNSGKLFVYRDWSYDEYPGGPPYSQSDVRVNTAPSAANYPNVDSMPLRLWLSDQKPRSFLLTWRGKIQLCWFDSVAWIWTDKSYPATAPGEQTNRTLHMPLTAENWYMANAPDRGVDQNTGLFSLYGNSTIGTKMVSDNAVMISPVTGGSANAPNRISLNTDDAGFLNWGSAYRVDSWTSNSRSDQIMDDPLFFRVLLENKYWWLVYAPFSHLQNTFGRPSLAFKCSEERPPAP